MHVLAEICIRRPVFATVLIIIMVVFGVYGYTQLGLDRFPKIDIPFMTVTTTMPGSAPEEIEQEITDKIEEAVNTISGIDDLRSVSSEGISQVYISFVLEKNIDVASQEVRDKVNRVIPDLPKGVDQPFVEKMDPDAVPVITLAATAADSVRNITEYCDKTLKRRLESLQGVGQVRIIGGQKRQINIQLDPSRLKAHGVSAAEVAQAVATQNVQLPGGNVKFGATDYTVRTLGRVSDVPGLSRIAIRYEGDHAITVSDVGKVVDGTEELESLSQFDDSPTVLVEVRKQSGTNTVAVADKIKERLVEIAQSVPKGYRVEIVRDQSVFVKDSVRAVEEHLVLGAIFAAIVVFFFLANVRMTAISALAIPTSIISAFAVVHWMGFTLNSLTLLALTLAVGIVIDDAIVVMENIFRLHEERGLDPFEAAREGTREIGLAVMVITLSLVSVFIPVALMSGIVGRFLYSFGVTIVSAIVVSLIVSFTLTPMLAARWLKKEPARVDASGEGESKHNVLYHSIELAYSGALSFVLRHRWVVVLVSAGLLATIPSVMRRIPKNFIPDDDQSQFQVSIRAPEGTSLEATNLMVQRLATDIRGLEGVRYTIASVADTEQKIANQGSIYVRMVDLGERTFSQMEMMEYVRRDVLPAHARDNLRVSLAEVPVFSGGGMTAASLQYVLGGRDMAKLETYAKALMDALRQTPGVTDVDSSLVVGKPQLGVSIDRDKAAALGVSVSNIASTLRLLVAGSKVSDYNEGGEQYDVFLQANDLYRNDPEELKQATVPSSLLGSVPLSDVVRFEKQTGPSEINRLNRMRQVTLSANMEEGASLQTAIDALDKKAAELNMGPEYKTGLIGRSREMARAFRGFFFVFVLAFLFAYLVMAAQFESWLHPFTILLAFPLTLPFAFLSLLLFRQSLNIFSILGMLVLFAVVMKNAILQIDHTNQLRAQGMARFDALMIANRHRLRPILMTTTAFVAGMLPLLVSESSGAATNRAISSVIIGGQTLSLTLTLLAIPVAYSLFDDAGASIRKLFGRKYRVEPPAEASRTPTE
ncbi:efflux RND transporter permease subunit [Candidatus Sumerlaeota bacterium]|nr:efflux RND transporter permease subunit [Candidatus Sumerlaeota bacterium]